MGRARRGRAADLRRRARTVAGSARLAVGATVGVLLFLVPLVVLVALLATGHTGDVAGLVVAAGLSLTGLYVVADALGQADGEDAPQQVVVDDGIYGRTVTLPEPTEPAPRAGRAVAVVLLLLVTVPLAIAVVMSQLDGWLRGHRALAGLVVAVLVAVVSLGVRLVVRRVTTRQRASEAAEVARRRSA